MFKKFAAWLMLSASLIFPLQAHADLSDAFSGLMATSNITKPGSFESQSRHMFTGGAMDIHFQGGAVQFISASAPSIKAGCNGISFYFGGFSFINSAEFKKLIKQISGNASGYAVQLAIKALCPQCDAVLSEMNKLAQQARKMASDTCSMAKFAVDKLISLSPELEARKNAVPQTCAEIKSADNKDADFFTAISSSSGECAMVNGLKAINHSIDDIYAAMTPKEKGEGKGAALLIGNSTWNAIKALGIGAEDPTGWAEREFLMSMIGTTIMGDSKGDGASQGKYFPPTLTSVTIAQNLLMCGTRGSQDAALPVSKRYCIGVESDFLKGDGPVAMPGALTADLILYECVEKPDCLEMKYADGATSPFVGKGFMPLVEESLLSALKAVKQGTLIPDPAIRLINTAPFPLYQAINIAAVYPDTADSLVSNMTRITALLMAQTYLRRIVTGTDKTVRQMSVNGQAVKELRQLLVNIDAESGKNFEELTKLYTMQEALTVQIKNINKRIQSEVVSTGLIGNQTYAVGLMKNSTSPTGGSR